MSDAKQQAYPTIRESWVILGVNLLLLIVTIPIGIIAYKFLDDQLAFLIAYVFVNGMVFWWAYGVRKSKTGMSSFSYSSSSMKIILLVSLGIFGLQNGLTIPLVSLIPISDWWLEALGAFDDENIYSLIAAVIAAPVLEELLFRGIILDGFLRLYSPKKAILYSSFLFGLVHMNPWQFITAMVGGVFMGWVYYRTKNLLLCILIHFVNNFIPSVASYFLGPEMNIELSYTEYYGGIAPMIIITITALIVAFTSIFLLYEEFEMREKIEWGELDPAVEEHHQVHKVGV